MGVLIPMTKNPLALFDETKYGSTYQPDQQRPLLTFSVVSILIVFAALALVLLFGGHHTH